MAALAPVLIGWVNEARMTAMISDGNAGRIAAQTILTDALSRGAVPVNNASATVPGGTGVIPQTALIRLAGTGTTAGSMTFASVGGTFAQILGVADAGVGQFAMAYEGTQGHITTFVYVRAGSTRAVRWSNTTSDWERGTVATVGDPSSTFSV
jgi:hypothetical protein